MQARVKLLRDARVILVIVGCSVGLLGAFAKPDPIGERT